MPEYEGLGKLAAFTAFAAVLGFVLTFAGLALDVPWWAIAVALFGILFVAAWALRRQESGRWSYQVRRYEADLDGRRVELLFDERMVILNRLTLEVDGETVDRDTLFYGRKTLADGGEPPITVEVGSGWVGTCTGAVARSAGSERQMSETSVAA